MEWSILARVSHLFGITGILLGATLTTVRADPIPAYTVTDLGEGTAQFSKDANGNGIIITPDGRTAYAFPTTDNRLSDPSILTSLPPLTNAPIHDPQTNGDPNNAYSQMVGFNFLNQNGLFVGTDDLGVNGHAYSTGESLVLASQRQADGTYGPFTTLWTSQNNLASHQPIAQANFLNNLNQVLGESGQSGIGDPSVFYLADVNSHTLIRLYDQVTNWHLDAERGLDDQGRILLLGGNFFSSTGGYQEHTLLLTPAGVSSDPMSVPEPTSLATFTLGLGYLAFRRRRSREPGSDAPR